TFLEKHELPALYRVHDGPPLERQEKLRAFLGELGLTLHKGKEGPTPKDYQALLERIQGRPDFNVIQTVMLRSLSQAVYSIDNHGHFGLNYEAYAHFTSPIRRYPDLLVHRAIRSVIRSRRDTPHVRREGATSMPRARIYPYDEAALEQLGEQCSMTERRADEATRDVVNWLKCEFMKDRVGETFPGVITAVTGFGLFVELTDIYVEGLVHVTAMPGDYYHFDPLHHRLSGERSGRSFRLGDSVEVRVMRVDLDERKIDFELISGGSQGKGAPADGGRAGARRTEGGKGDRSASRSEEPDADVRKSREMKKALLAEAKAGKPAASGKPKRNSGKPKANARAGGKPAAEGAPRKRKAKAGVTSNESTACMRPRRYCAPIPSASSRSGWPRGAAPPVSVFCWSWPSRPGYVSVSASAARWMPGSRVFTRASWRKSAPARSGGRPCSKSCSIVPRG